MKHALCRNLRAGLAVVLWITTAGWVSAQEGHWEISQLSIRNALHPVINNNDEIVWYENADGGVYSSVRGKLADSGSNPHLANSGEVVYADWFGGPAWDLVSTTRGRLTFGSLIDINRSNFDVNALGEVVYVTQDTNRFYQVYSTIRNQITFDAVDHYNPCINDLGEIIWNQHLAGVGAVAVSTTRGLLPGSSPALMDLNNSGEFCFSGSLEGPPGYYSWPHLFSSAHGVLINDPSEFQWDGSLNDAGTILWRAPEHPGSFTWYVYKAEWVTRDTTPPLIVDVAAMPGVLWPPNHRMVAIEVRATVIDEVDPSPTIRIIDVTSNEPRNAFRPDYEITGPLRVNLRAERLGKGRGRIYTILLEAEDSDGNVSYASVAVLVPHHLHRN